MTIQSVRLNTKTEILIVRGSEDSQFFPLLLPLDLSLDLPFEDSLPLEDLPPFPPLSLGGCAGSGGR